MSVVVRGVPLVEAHLIELRERLSALEAFAAVDQLILAGADLDPVIDALLEGMASVMRCDHACIGLPSTAAPGLWDLHVDVVDAAGAHREVLRQQTGADPGRPRLGPVPTVLRKAGARVVQAWPVILDTRVVAIIGVGFRGAVPLDPALGDALDGFAQRLSLALARDEREERLYRQAHFDALTGLPNRLLFREQLAGELQRVGEGALGGALLYLDLDDFKRVNDTLGHAAGDQMLTLAGQRLRGCVKERDTVARLGGDEFTVILRALPEPVVARQIAERIIVTLSAPMWLSGERRQAGVSIGIAVFPDDARDGDELIRLADAAMYRAKQQGSDRIAWHRPR
jgi:diguanylate cyclase (GGDEF)-like protein